MAFRLPPPALVALLFLLHAPMQVFAQGVLPLQGTYHYGAIGGHFGSPCSGTAANVFSESGMMTFSKTGTWNAALRREDICTGGTRFVTAPAPGGTYAVHSGGYAEIVEIVNPTTTNKRRFYVRPFGDVLVYTRKATRSEPSIVVCLAGSSNKNTGSLNGNYHVVRMIQNNAPAGLITQNDFGTINFDGTGGWTESGNRMTVLANGKSTIAPYTTGPGTYNVTTSGRLTANSSHKGGISPDGEVFFWTIQTPTTSGMAVGVRKGGPYRARDFAGDWILFGHHLDLARTCSPMFFTEVTDLGVQQINSTIGIIDVFSFSIDTCALGSGSGYGTSVLSFSINTGGAISVPASTRPAMGLSSTGTMIVGASFESGETALFFGLRKCRWPLPYGKPTPGTGGFLPSIEGAGGFPNTGNSLFKVRIGNGLCGAPGLLSLSLAPHPTGLSLLGGLVWIDLGQVLAWPPLKISSPCNPNPRGIANITMPIPADPALNGIKVFCQGFIQDVGAPAGWAMTSGLRIEIFR